MFKRDFKTIETGCKPAPAWIPQIRNSDDRSLVIEICLYPCLLVIVSFSINVSNRKCKGHKNESTSKFPVLFFLFRIWKCEGDIFSNRH